MNAAKRIFPSLALSIALIGCTKSQTEGSQSLNLGNYPAYHDVLPGADGKAVYTIVSFPTDDKVEIRRYYLKDDKSTGTYSIDRASVVKTGQTWKLVFAGSDCVPDNTTVSWTVILNDEQSFDYSVTTSPAVIYRLDPAEQLIYKLTQYNIASYQESSDFCD